MEDRKRGLALLAGLAAILAWQYGFFRHGDPAATLRTPYRLEASNGVASWQPEFVYFLYYLNLYPIVSLADSPTYSEEGARKLIREEGSSLAMDRYWTVRYGDLAKTYLYLPHAWLKGRPVRLRMLHANAFGFTLALVALYSAFWYARRTVLGSIIVILMGSNPFQVNEVYATNNLFGWPITTALLVLALHVPFLQREQGGGREILALAVGSGMLLGTMRQVRTEPTLVLLGVAVVYLTVRHLRLRRRLLAVVVLGGTFALTSSGWTTYFDTKFREAHAVVKAAGGHVYDGPRHSYHFFWHALWCGLGDFDQKYGHRWSDITAFNYAWAILQQRHDYRPSGYPPRGADPTDVFSFAVYWDRGRQYPRTPYEIPEYTEIIRSKVLRDILHDPAWYLGILGRRAGRLLAESTPPSLALGNGMSLSLPGRAVWGYLAIVIAILLYRRRNWFGLRLMGLTLPLAGTAILVYSGGGTTLYSVAHLIALGVICAEALHGFQWPGVGATTSGRAAGLRRRQWPTPSRGGLALVLAGAGLLLGIGAAARRLLPPTASEDLRDGWPQVVVLRFDNETSDEQLAWVADAVGDAVADGLTKAGLRIVGPDAAENLDADLVWWGPYGAPNVPRAVAMNVAADRSSAARIVAGRVRTGPGGLMACATVFTAATRSEGPERCEPVADRRVPEASLRILDGLAAALEVPRPAGAAAGGWSAGAESLRLDAEARRAERRQRWGDADRLLGQRAALESDSESARPRRARLRLRWQPLNGEALQLFTGERSPGRALAVLQRRVARDPDSASARLDTGRLLVALELYPEAQEVLSPLRSRPAVSPEAFELLAEALSARGSLDLGYLAAHEYLRRSWREPRGDSLLAQHLLRWHDLDRAALALENAARDRLQRGQAETTLDDLVTDWRIRALRGEWDGAEQLAYRMTGVDDPRARGTGYLHTALVHLFRGRPRIAGALAEEAVFQLAQQGLDPARAVQMAAEMRLETGDLDGAIHAVRGTQASASADPRLRVLEGVALARAGRWSEARTVRERLEDSVPSWPGPIARRAVHQLDGELALARDEVSAAVRSFSEAERLLPARGFCGDHVPVWYGLGRAHLAAKDRRQAEAWLERVTQATFERLCWPIPYARSLALLGRTSPF